jgi:anaerobic selenocysteine-containing dehydrogenase
MSCGILVHIKEGKIEKIEGDPEHPWSKGMICPKGIAYRQVVYHPDRLTHPMKRVGERGEGRWKKVSWDEALDTIASELLEVRGTYGPESIAACCGGNPRRSMPATRFLTDSMGSPNWAYSDAFYCWGPHVVAESVTYGGRITSDINCDFANSNCIIVWGGNPVHTHPVVGRDIMMARARGAKIVVVDPRMTATASKANIWLQLRPGTDAALALSMLNVIINESIYDKEFVRKWCVGFEELKERTQSYCPEKVAEITDVPADDIKCVARLYATSKPACLYLRVGNELIFNSTQASRAIASLIAITGNIDIKGGNLFPCTPKGLLGRLFYAKKQFRLSDEIEEKRIGAKEFPLLSGSKSPLGLFHTPLIIKAMLTGKPYPIRALVAANNLCVSMPNSREVFEALKSLSLLVVYELFMTTTAEIADFVLPAATYFEIDELTNRYVNFATARRKVIEPVGESWDELKISHEIIKRMGLKFTLWHELQERGWEGYEDFQLKDTGFAFKDIKAGEYIFAPMEYRKYENNGFQTPTGKVELYSSIFEEFGYDPLPSHVEPFESPISSPELSKEFPFILITGGRVLAYFHSLGHQVPWLRELVPDPIIEIHPDTGAELGIKEGDWVWVETPRGRGRIKQKAKLTRAVHPKVVHCVAQWWYPEKNTPDHGAWDSNINVITYSDPPYEPICGTCAMRGLLCKVYKEKEE